MARWQGEQAALSAPAAVRAQSAIAATSSNRINPPRSGLRRDRQRGRLEPGGCRRYANGSGLAGGLHDRQAHPVAGLHRLGLVVFAVGRVAVVHTDQLTWALDLKRDRVIRV